MGDKPATTIQNDEQAESAKKDRDLKRMRELDDVKEVMSTAAGRRLLWRMLEDGKIFHPCFTGNSKTFYQEGQRELMLKYFNEIMVAAPQEFALMQEENLQERKEFQQTSGEKA